MLFVLFCEDEPGSFDLRSRTRAAHLAYIEATGVVAQAGPLLDAAGAMCGSLLILDVGDHAAARAWAEHDPYAQAGLFARVEIRAWKRVIG